MVGKNKKCKFSNLRKIVDISKVVKMFILMHIFYLYRHTSIDACHVMARLEIALSTIFITFK